MLASLAHELAGQPISLVVSGLAGRAEDDASPYEALATAVVRVPLTPLAATGGRRAVQSLLVRATRRDARRSG